MTAIENPADSFNGQQAVTTSYYGLGGDGSLVGEAHCKWDTALIAVFTIWTSDFPEVALNSVVPGEWIQQDPPSGYTAISPAGAATVGANPLVVTVPGGTAGGCSMNMGNYGSKRMRIRVVCTQAGQLRIRPNGKD